MMTWSFPAIGLLSKKIHKLMCISKDITLISNTCHVHVSAETRMEVAICAS
jgi:hypothetical protein